MIRQIQDTICSKNMGKTGWSLLLCTWVRKISPHTNKSPVLQQRWRLLTVAPHPSNFKSSARRRLKHAHCTGGQTLTSATTSVLFPTFPDNKEKFHFCCTLIEDHLYQITNISRSKDLAWVRCWCKVMITPCYLTDKDGSQRGISANSSKHLLDKSSNSASNALFITIGLVCIKCPFNQPAEDFEHIKRFLLVWWVSEILRGNKAGGTHSLRLRRSSAWAMPLWVPAPDGQAHSPWMKPEIAPQW